MPAPDRRASFPPSALVQRAVSIGRAGSSVYERLRREARLVRGRFALPKLRLVHADAYRLPDNPLADPERGGRIRRYLAGARFFDDDAVIEPPAIRLVDLLRVHDRRYLESLDAPNELARIFGGGAPSTLAAQGFLVAQRRATAGTVHAVELALRYPWLRSPVVNLGGGFHHARHDRGGGFCAFNDIAVAIDRVRAGGFTGRVLVIDLDLHHGDGTRSIFADDDRVFTASIHAEHWDETPAIASLDIALGPGVGDDTYLRAVEDMLGEAHARAHPDLVIYVAGVDVAAGDALGGWRISPAGVAARDRLVLERARGLPTAMVLAGGYGPDAWRHTARSLVWLLTGEDRAIPAEHERALFRFREIRRHLRSRELHEQPGGEADGFRLTEEDLYGDLLRKDPDPRFLGFYTEYGLELAFERYGLAEHLRKKGYEHYVVTCEQVRDGNGQTLRVLTADEAREPLIELVVNDSREVAGKRLLSIEWLLLQDPHAKPKGPLLPGQKYPGLGGASIVVGMLVMACERLGYDGLTLVPAHFHIAALARRLFVFLDPADEAFFLALCDATRGQPIQAATETIARSGVIDLRTGSPVSWRPSRMVLGISRAMKDELSDPSYALRVEQVAAELRFALAPSAAPGSGNAVPTPSV